MKGSCPLRSERQRGLNRCRIKATWNLERFAIQYTQPNTASPKPCIPECSSLATGHNGHDSKNGRRRARLNCQAAGVVRNLNSWEPGAAWQPRNCVLRGPSFGFVQKQRFELQLAFASTAHAVALHVWFISAYRDCEELGNAIG